MTIFEFINNSKMDNLNLDRVLIPMDKNELESIFDETSRKVFEYFLRKSFVSQPEKLPNQKDLPIQIPKEHIEQWVCQSIGAIPVGAGSYAVDVISKNSEWGADIKMLSCKTETNSGKLTNSDSGETSLAQKFDDGNFGDGNTLDDLFRNKEFDIIWDNWKGILLNKYKKVNDDFNVSEIYYFFILRANLDYHLCGMKVDLENLNKTEINVERSTNDSVWIKNYIDDNFGHVKVYKAKKRFELRLKPKYWVENDRVITFTTKFEQLEIDIRKLIESDELHLHISNNLIPFLVG